MSQVKFDVWQVACFGYVHFFKHPIIFLRLAWKSYVLTIAGSFLVTALQTILKRQGYELTVLSQALQLFVGVVAVSYFGLAFYRYYLLGWTSETQRVRLRIRRREFLYINFMLLSMVPWGLIGLLYNFAPEFGLDMANKKLWTAITYALNTFMALALVRIVYISPAIAVDMSQPVVQGWKLAEGAWLRLCGVWFLTYAPYMFLNAYVYEVMTSFVDPLISSLLSTAMFFVAHGISLLAMSRAFQLRVGQTSPVAG